MPNTNINIIDDRDVKEEKEMDSSIHSTENLSRVENYVHRFETHSAATFTALTTNLQSQLGMPVVGLNDEFRIFFMTLIDTYRVDFERMHLNNSETLYHFFYLLKSARDLLAEHIE